MMRKSDVYSSVKKLLVLSGQSVDWAIEEGRQETEEFHRIRRRALYTIRDEFLDNCPIFINPETVKERGHD